MLDFCYKQDENPEPTEKPDGKGCTLILGRKVVSDAFHSVDEQGLHSFFLNTLVGVGITC